MSLNMGHPCGIVYLHHEKDFGPQMAQDFSALANLAEPWLPRWWYSCDVGWCVGNTTQHLYQERTTAA